METQLDKRLLLMLRQGSENLGGIKQVVFVVELVDVECKQWQVQQEDEPEAIDQEKDSQKHMDGSLRDEPWVQLMTQLDWVDVVTLQVGVHDGEKHLSEQVHNVDNDGKNKQPEVSIEGAFDEFWLSYIPALSSHLGSVLLFFLLQKSVKFG